MPANSVRPWIRLLVAYRDRGVCKICGKKVEAPTSIRRLKRGYRDGALPQGGEIIYGEKQPTIDHLSGKGSGYEKAPNNRFYIYNLSLAHKDCNSQKKENGDIPTERQIEATYRVLSGYDIDKIRAILSEMGYSEKDVRGDRSLGRSIFREFAIHMASTGAKKKKQPPPDDEFPF